MMREWTVRKTLVDMYCDAHAALVHLAQALDLYDVNIDAALAELEDAYPVVDENAEVEFEVPAYVEGTVHLAEEEVDEKEWRRETWA